jgi:hypothetical protein
MRQNWKLSRLGGLLFALATAVSLTACAPEVPTVNCWPASADEVVAAFQWAWEEADSTALDCILADGFSVVLDPAYVARAGLPNDLMSGSEVLRSAGWIFSGQSVFYDGDPQPGVTDIGFVTFEQLEAWIEVADPEGYGTLRKARHAVELEVHRQSGLDVSIAGEMVLYATWRDSAGSDLYELARLEDFTEPIGKDATAKAYGELLVEYLVNRAPVAIIAVADTAQTVDEVFDLDAADSFDHDGPLHAEPYRWRLDPDGWWSAWTADPDTTVTYAEPGTKAISLEVRDRWGLTHQAHQTLTVTPAPTPFPDSADKLVENFVDGYTEREIDYYRSALHPDFKFILNPPDGGETYYDYDTDVTIAATMFSGEQGPGDDARPISAIQMVAYPLGVWEDVPENEPEFGGHGAVKRTYAVDIAMTRPGYNTFLVQGEVLFYAVRRDSLHDGELRDYWELLGQWDFTAQGGKATENASWSEVKALYR